AHARPVAAGTVGVNTGSMGKALQSGQSVLDDVVIGCPPETGHKAGTAGVVVRVSPIGVLAHSRLSNGEGQVVQRRICIRRIDFLAEVIWKRPMRNFTKTWSLRRSENRVFSWP